MTWWVLFGTGFTTGLTGAMIPGPVMLEEANEDHSEGQVFVVSDWRLIRSFRYDTDGTRPFLAPLPEVDHEVSQTLMAHLLRHPRAVKPYHPDPGE